MYTKNQVVDVAEKLDGDWSTYIVDDASYSGQNPTPTS